jgi:hypothetical protein
MSNKIRRSSRTILGVGIAGIHRAARWCTRIAFLRGFSRLGPNLVMPLCSRPPGASIRAHADEFLAPVTRPQESGKAPRLRGPSVRAGGRWVRRRQSQPPPGRDGRWPSHAVGQEDVSDPGKSPSDAGDVRKGGLADGRSDGERRQRERRPHQTDNLDDKSLDSRSGIAGLRRPTIAGGQTVQEKVYRLLGPYVLPRGVERRPKA